MSHLWLVFEFLSATATPHERETHGKAKKRL